MTLVGTPEPIWAKISSFVLAPKFVLTCLWAAIIIGFGTAWGAALFWALIALTSVCAFLVLAGAKPLRPLKEKSHLFLRLAWLGRYGTATAMLCLSTFLGVVAGVHAGASDPQSIVNSAGGLIGLLAAWAAKLAALMFFGWLAIDLYRIGDTRREKAVRRCLRKWLGRDLAHVVVRPVIVRWFMVLSSRPVVTISFAALVVGMWSAFPSTGQ